MTQALDFSRRATSPLDFSQRAVRLDRSMTQRAADNIGDGARRSGLGAIARSADPEADGLLNLRDLTKVRPGSPADFVLDRIVGPERQWFASDEAVPSLGQVVKGQAIRGRPAAAAEDARRANYDARGAADPISNPGDALAYFGGQVLGGAPSPENWIGGGAGGAVTRVGRPLLDFAARAAGRVVEHGAIAASTDVALQAGDIQSGIETKYSPLQTLLAAGVGGVIGGTVDIATPAAGRAATAGGRAALDFSGRASGIAREGVARASSALTNPMPAFDGPAMDARPANAAAVRPQQARQAVVFAAPVSGRVSSEFGSRRRPNAKASANHQGVDYAVPEGTPVAAAAEGEVIFAGRRGNYGNRVVIRHADGSESTYSHLSGFDVRVGDQVAAGQAVARSGSTGNVTGPHLHFEIRHGGGYVDPRSRLSGEHSAQGATVGAAVETPRTPRVSEAEAMTYPGQAEAGSPDVSARRAREELGLDGLGMNDAALGVRPTTGLDFSARARPADDVELQVRAAEAAAIRPIDAIAEPMPANPRAPFGGLDFSARASSDPAQKLAIDMSGYADRLGETVQSSGQARFGLRDAPRPDAVARGAGSTFEGMSVSQLADNLRTALGLTHRQGRVGARGALGTYDTGSGVVRTKAVDELDVLAHEATHALEYERKGPALDAALKLHGNQLEALAYPGAAMGVRRQEGFAEFGRWYLTNPDHARRIAPGFFDAFERAMETDAPDVLAGMRAVQGGYQNLLSSASIDVAKGSLAYTGSKGPVGNLIDEVKRKGPGSVARRLTDKVYTALIDDLHPLHIAERDLSALYLANSGQKLDLKRSASPYALARLSREAYAAGHGDLMNGVTPYRGMDPEGASLADALETAGLDTSRLGSFKQDALDEFDVYLIARRMVHEWDRYAQGDLPNPPDRNTRQFHEQVMRDAEASNPTWPKAAGQVYEFLNNLWRKEFEAGLITRESYEHGMTAHPDYVPLMRDMSDKGPGKGGKPRGALQFAGGVKAFEGSSRDIISPLSSIMRRSYELNAIIKRNDVMKALDDLAQAAGRGAGAIVERLPAKEIEAFTVNAEDALRKTADELGLTGRDLSTMQKFADDAAATDTTVTLFKQSEFAPRKGEAVVFVWRGGKKTPLLLADGEFGQQMFTALSGMSKDLSNIVVDSMAAATMALRYGVTLSPEFMAANVVRDSLATWINTDVGFVPVVDTIRGGAMEVSQGQIAQRYGMVGGMRGGTNTAATRKPFPRSDAEATAQLQHLRRKGWKVSVRGFAQLTDLSETATRLGMFARSFEKAKASGLNEYDALIEAGFTSRDYLDFGRRGSRMLTASRVVTFLNAALQGLDKSVRVLTAGGNLKAVLHPLTKEARTPAEKAALGHAYKAMAKIAALGALGLGLRMLYADDPEYQEINERLRATHWIYRANGQWIFIPKPFELATVSNALERAFEGTVLKDPLAGERFLSDLRHTVLPPSEIPALAVPFHVGRNRDYLGRPIVADHLKGSVDPELQFNSYTSDLGKLIGKTLKVSPAVVDYVVTGFGGSLGRYALQGSNLVGEAVTGRARTAAGPEDMFLARRFIRNVARGAESQAEFWDQVGKDGGEMTRAEGTFRSLLKANKDAEATAYLNKLSPEDRGYVLAKVFSEDGSSRDHPMVRAQGVVSVLSDFRTNLKEGSLRDDTGALIDITPQQRRTIDTAMADMAMAEMRNALIEAGVEGWTQKRPLSTLAPAERIGQTSPAVALQLRAWLAQARAPTVFHPQQLEATQKRWAARAPSMTAQVEPERLAAGMQAERMSGNRLDRYQEKQRLRGAMTGQSTTSDTREQRLMTGGQ